MMWPFKKKKAVLDVIAAVEELIHPNIGDPYILKRNDGSPWDRKDRPPVQIIDAHGGWVRYRIGHIFEDERMELKMFLDIYEHKHLIGER